MTEPSRFPDYAAFAANMRERKERRYPALVQKKRVRTADAERDIAVWRAIEADWRFAAKLSGQPGSEIRSCWKIAALELALERAQSALSRNRHSEAHRQEVQILRELLTWQRSVANHVQLAQINLFLRKHTQRDKAA